MKIPLVKLKAILVYFTNKTNVKFLGKVKLMKLFYFLDFIHLKKYGSPVTYDTYIKLEHGPIPSFIKNLIDSAADDIERSELADVIDVERPDGIKMYRFLPQRKFTEKDKELFSKTELEVLQQVCAKLGDKNTKYVEDVSHKEASWKNTGFFEKIPYAIASQDSDCKISEKDLHLLGEIL